VALEFDVLHMGLRLSFRSEGAVQAVQRHSDGQHAVRLRMRHLECVELGRHDLAEDGLFAELDRRIAGSRPRPGRGRSRGCAS
jgi:hypothetical protein